MRENVRGEKKRGIGKKREGRGGERGREKGEASEGEGGEGDTGVVVGGTLFVVGALIWCSVVVLSRIVLNLPRRCVYVIVGGLGAEVSRAEAAALPLLSYKG